MKKSLLLAAALLNTGAMANDDIYTIKKGDWYLHRNIHGENSVTLYTTGNSQITRLAYQCSRSLEYAEMMYEGFSQTQLYVEVNYRIDDDFYGRFLSGHDHNAKLVTAENLIGYPMVQALKNGKTLTVKIWVHEGKTSTFGLEGFSELYPEYRSMCNALNPKTKAM